MDFFIIGGILGYLANLFFYLKSKNDSNEKNLDRLFNLYNKTIDNKSDNLILKDIKDEIGTKNSLEKIHNELVIIKAKLDNSVTPDAVIRYRLLGELWSDEYLKAINPSILTKDGKLYFENILEFHKTIFPGGYPWAGKIRTHEVIISSSFGTILPQGSQGTVDYNVKPVKHSEIPIRIQDFCLKWNKNLKSYTSYTTEDKITTISEYHHEFQIIHPFHDGNGRIGRIILNDMVAFLLNRRINPTYEREDYYLALRFADMGDLKKLNEFIYKQIES